MRWAIVRQRRSDCTGGSWPEITCFCGEISRRTFRRLLVCRCDWSGLV